MLTKTGHSRKTRNLSKKCYIRHCQTSRHLHRVASCYFPAISQCAGINDLNDTVLGYEVIAEAFPKERFLGWRLAGEAGGRWGSHPAGLSVPAELRLRPRDPLRRAERSRPAAQLPACPPRPPAPFSRARSSGTRRDPAERGWSRRAAGAQPGRSRVRAAPSQRAGRRGERRNLPRPGGRAPLCREATRAPPPEHPFNSGSDGD